MVKLSQKCVSIEGEEKLRFPTQDVEMDFHHHTEREETITFFTTNKFPNMIGDELNFFLVSDELS